MKTRNLIQLLFVLALATPVQSTWAQVQGDWSYYAGGTHADVGSALASDSLGNIYVAGSFQGQSTFSGKTISSNGDTDIYLAKYDSEGNLLWIRQAGSNYSRENTITEYPTAIAVTSKGVYLTGVFSRVGIFDSFKLVSAGKDDIFLAKYSLDGEIQWAVKGGGESQDIPYGLAVDKNENVYLTGAFQKKARFGNQILHANNYKDLFINKYDEAGELLWAKQSFSPSKAVGKSIEIFDDQIFVAGEFSGELSLEGQNLKANGSSELFLASFSTRGDLITAKSFGSDGSDEIRQMKIIDGNIYVTGSFQTGTSNETWTSYGSKDAFIQKLTLDGEMLWNKTLGGESIDIGQSLGADAHGNIIAAGNFSKRLQLNDSIYHSSGYTDMYVIRLTQNGVINYFEGIGGSNQDQVNRLAISKNHVVITGFFRGSEADQIKSFGGSDMFLIKMNIQDRTNDLTKVTYVTYPNPSEGAFLISGSEIIETIAIYNQSGIAVLKNHNVNTYEYKIDLANMPNGVYIVEINGTANKKMIIY